MIRYNSPYQTQITEFSNLYNLKLDPQNRWIQLGSLLPWDRMVSLYKQSFSCDQGAPAVNPRHMIGALIIKHKLNLTDDQTLQAISENPYMQFFLGLQTFCPEPLFSASLLPEARKRLPRETIEVFNELIIKASHPELTKQAPSGGEAEPAENKGKLKIDATVADQYIRYPNDLSLAGEARLKAEAIIDQLWEMTKGQLKVKPRTYRQIAHKRYLGEAKKKRKSTKSIRKALRYLLNCVRRNLGHIDQMLDLIGGQAFPLAYKYQRQLWIIHTLYGQQRGMYDERSRRCPDRIVSLFGHYPELIQADKIYWTNANRSWCREHGIRLTAVPKGRPPKKTARQKRRERKEYAERNHIEGRIGNAEQTFSLNQIKAKLRETSEVWIALTIFVMNLSVFATNLNATF